MQSRYLSGDVFEWLLLLLLLFKIQLHVHLPTVIILSRYCSKSWLVFIVSERFALANAFNIRNALVTVITNRKYMMFIDARPKYAFVALATTTITKKNLYVRYICVSI